MTRIQDAEVVCPKCSTKQEAKIWQSINLSVDPEAKQKLFNGEVNRFECPKCGEIAYMDVPFMYHDMENEFVVQFFPPSVIQDKTFLKQFTPQGKLKMDMGIEGYFSEPHIVFSMQELVMYIIFRDKLAQHP